MRSPRPCPPPGQHPPTSAQPASTSRHAENQNEFPPSYIAQLEYEIANPRLHSEICEEIRQGILKQSLQTERADLMWKRAIAIGHIRLKPLQPLHGVWSTVSPKRKTAIKTPLAEAQVAKILKAANSNPNLYLYPRTEREVVIEFDSLLKQLAALACNSARNVVNKMLIDRKDVTAAPFVNARFSRNNNSVLTTPSTKDNIEYEAYLGSICEALSPLGRGIPHINEKWTKFVAHGVPTRANITRIQSDVHLHIILWPLHKYLDGSLRWKKGNH
jgi:hypothetical protein